VVSELIERYAAGGPLLAKVIEGLTPEELNAFPIPGTWSLQQIVLHMTDSDLIASDRMKRVIAEENPTLVGYDETAFSKNLFYEKLDPQLACMIFDANRRQTATLLRLLPPAAFSRTGNHSEHGPMSLDSLVKVYAEHLDHHMKFVREKRAKLGKPLAGI
jgi:hypothetical protein